MKTTAEQRAYSRGYQAGKKRADLEFNHQLADIEREQFRREAALVALDGLMRSGRWGKTVDGVHKPYKNMDEYAAAAFEFADRLAKHSFFSGLVVRPTQEGGAAQ